MNHVTFTWKTKDHIRIHAQGWEPQGEIKAVMGLVHGLGEHSGRYSHLAAYVTQAQYALVTFDLRGHGKSDGQRGFTPDIDALLEDI